MPDYRCVSPSGSDSNDGLSWNAPKLTIEAAVAALPNGGQVFLAPTGSRSAGGTPYTPATTITLNGHVIEGAGNPRQTLGTGAPTRGEVCIEHSFNGDLFNVNVGSIERCLLFSTGTYTGAAIKSVSGDAALGIQNSGYVYVRDVVISGSTGWERDIYIDGTGNTAAAGPGARSYYFDNVLLFGARTAGETVLLKRCIHLQMNACKIFPAPTATTQGVKITDVLSEDILFTNCWIETSELYTEAAGLGVAWVGGYITGPITCAAGSANNRFAPLNNPTFTNNGAVSNARKQLAT